ncbi:hypothetical protein [Cohnella sp.]|uniref:hypothetical protein n=1 Tax=Cohnella sp. TaxID=1883426 RepID=UPI003562BD8B
MNRSLTLADREYEDLLEEQKDSASGARLELLQKHGEGERKLLVDVVWPVRQSFSGIVLEKEIATLTGAKAYIDVFDETVLFGIEAEGYTVHAGNITRARFDFERNKVRSMASLGIRYIPFTYDEMDKKPEACRRALFELYGKYGTNADSETYKEATPNERELIRHAMRLGRPFQMSDVRICLRKGPEACRDIVSKR